VPALAPSLVHGTAISLAGRAALIRGSSGSGKSDLALRCLMQVSTPLVPEAASLVADDQVLVEPTDDKLFVSSPSSIRDLLEVRGIGVLRVPAIDKAELVLLVDLVPPTLVERFPDPPKRLDLLGVSLPVLNLTSFENSSSLKLLLALHGLKRN
jgi:HPr kinase/phosphorylase